MLDSVDIRYTESTETPTASAAKVTLLVADRRSSLVIELKDDLKDTFTEAVGRSNCSNNKIVVLSYIAIFENLWNQSELYQQIRQAYEQLKIHDTMHEEFINMAAHELRNPIQPIHNRSLFDTVLCAISSCKQLLISSQTSFEF